MSSPVGPTPNLEKLLDPKFREELRKSRGAPFDDGSSSMVFLLAPDEKAEDLFFADAGDFAIKRQDPGPPLRWKRDSIGWVPLAPPIPPPSKETPAPEGPDYMKMVKSITSPKTTYEREVEQLEKEAARTIATPPTLVPPEFGASVAKPIVWNPDMDDKRFAEMMRTRKRK